jgi:hypothetical protein
MSHVLCLKFHLPFLIPQYQPFGKRQLETASIVSARENDALKQNKETKHCAGGYTLPPWLSKP